jgi:hypothetical protein
VKIAYIFATSGHTASYTLGKMILPLLEGGRHSVEVVGMFFFGDRRSPPQATPLERQWCGGRARLQPLLLRC